MRCVSSDAEGHTSKDGVEMRCTSESSVEVECARSL